MKITLVATTVMGLEAVLKREIVALGYTNITTLNGKVEFEGDLTDICKANLWLRSAGRIYIKLAEFRAVTFDQLFEQCTQIPWENWIQKNDEFPVSQVTSRNSQLFSKSDCQAIVKKAAVQRLKDKHKVSVLPETNALVPIRIQIDKDLVIISIDSTGSGLNKRGYRTKSILAPIRETLAAGLILLSQWKPNEEVFLDPFCGSGTFVIEAGLMAKNIAPGLNRSFCSEQWAIIPNKIWAQERTTAKDLINPKNNYRIMGSDIDKGAIGVANTSIETAGLENVFVQKLDIRDLGSKYDRGRIVTNPPYGERLSTEEEVEDLYQEMGHIFKTKFPEWYYYILTSHVEFEDFFGRQSTRHRKIFNGSMECRFHQFY